MCSADDREVPLLGGMQTHAIVKVGDTVRRPLNARSEYVHAVLRHLEDVGFDGAPRVLGVDESGREILTFIHGEVFAASPLELSDDHLRSAASLIRRFHDATAETKVARGGEVVCHGDLGPHNTVFDGTTAVGLIDWDEDLAPGPRLLDFAHAVWCFADIAEDTLPVAEQARRITVLCYAYGWSDPDAVIDEIAARMRRARDDHARHGRTRAVAIFTRYVDWMERNAPALKAAT